MILLGLVLTKIGAGEGALGNAEKDGPTPQPARPKTAQSADGFSQASAGAQSAVSLTSPERQPASSKPSATNTADPLLKSLAACFQPPAAWAGRMGAWPSPLRFRDGRTVTTAAEWSQRRQEIFDDWHRVMGAWPPLLTAPQLRTTTSSQKEGISHRRVRVDYAPNQTGEGWLLVPEGPGPFRAVLVVYYEPETSVGLNPAQPLRDFGLQLARRGFVTLSIGTPGGDARKPDLAGSTCQPLSYHAYVAANAWQALARMPEVDAARIGVVGHSYGGKWALFAGAFWDKFAAVAVSDPGIVFDETRPNVNYWDPWYLGWEQAPARPVTETTALGRPRTGAYARLRGEGRDLVEVHALLAPRPFFVSGGSEDPPERWQALNHLRAIHRVLGVTDRVGMSNRPDHAPSADSNALLYDFFEHALGPMKPLRAVDAAPPKD